MTKLTKYEQETILLTNENDDFWEVYTFNRSLKRRLMEFSRKCPEHCRLKEENPKLGCVTYLVNKGRLSLHLNAPQSEEWRMRAREYAKANRLGAEKM